MRVLLMRKFPASPLGGWEAISLAKVILPLNQVEKSPKLIISYDTRWFAISIFGATYTANLAAFLTINKYEHPIKSIEDLANQDRVKFGTAPGQLEKMLK